jgi:type IV pilus assembly protein PilA
MTESGIAMARALRKAASRPLLMKLQKEVTIERLGGGAVRKELLSQRTRVGKQPFNGPVQRRELSVMKRLRLQSESGFTLIELLVVVAIIGILAAIAIPQFSAYRKRGYEAQIKSDLRNAATAEEAYFAGTQPSTYKSGTLTSGNPTGFNNTTGVSLGANIGAETFILSASHANCTGVTWTYDSVGGQIAGGPCP